MLIRGGSSWLECVGMATLTGHFAMIVSLWSDWLWLKWAFPWRPVTSAFDLSHLNRWMKLWQWITFDGFLLSGGLTQRCHDSIFQLLFFKMLFILTGQFNTTVGRFYGNCHITIGFNDVIDWQRCHSNVFKWSLLFLKMLFILTCQFNTAVGRFNGECYADYCSFIM